jgi:hypothetical protein
VFVSRARKGHNARRAAKRRAKLTGEYREQFDAALRWALTGTSVDSGAMQFDPAEFGRGPASRIGKP